VKPLLCKALAFVVLSVPGYAFDFMTGQGNGQGQAQVLSYPSPSALLNVSSSGMAPGAWRVETGLNRPYEMKELDQAFIAAAYRWRMLTGSFGFSQLGQRDFYAERTAKWSVQYAYRQFVASAYYSILSLSFGGLYEGLSAGALGLGGGYHHDRFYAAFAADNLNSPILDRGSPRIRPVYSLFGELRTSKTLSTLVRTRFENGNPPQFAVGQKIGISAVSSLMWGLQSKPLQLGGGVEIGIAGGWISYTASYHPVLGLSHTIAVSYGSHSSNEGDGGFK
jgi:hypothetical protein